VLRTADAASEVPAAMIGTTFVLYLMLYALLIAAYVSVVFHLAKKSGTPDAAPAARPEPVHA